MTFLDTGPKPKTVMLNASSAKSTASNPTPAFLQERRRQKRPATTDVGFQRYPNFGCPEAAELMKNVNPRKLKSSEEFIEGEECCSLTSKKLRLKGPRETAPWTSIWPVLVRVKGFLMRTFLPPQFTQQGKELALLMLQLAKP